MEVLEQTTGSRGCQQRIPGVPEQELAGGGKRRGMKEAGGGGGQDETGPGDGGSAGQDRETRSPAGYGGPQWAMPVHISRSPEQLCVMVSRSFFRPCICTFVQQIYVVKLSYILSLRGPGHRSCPGSYYKIFLGKKARGIFVGCWPWVYPSVFCGWVSSYALKMLKLQSEGTDFEITTTHASATHSSENGPVFSF